MNARIKEILIGLTLGDGYITPFVGASKRSRMEVKGDNRYLLYLQWLRRELEPLGVSELKPKKNYHQHRFYTKTLEEIGKLRTLFYSNGKKVIPRNIKKFFNSPLTLAVWYQDDGTLDCRSKDHYNSLFATHCFSYNECAALANTLRENLYLEVRVYKCQMRGILRFRLYITSSSMERFISLVRPYITPCFAYKIRKFN